MLSLRTIPPSSPVSFPRPDQYCRRVQRWVRERSGELTAIVDEALPGENLSEDELVAIAFDDPDPTVVVGGDEGVAIGVVRRGSRGPHASIQLVAVRPSCRRRGVGRTLIDSVAEWAFAEHGATGLRAGGGAPFYLWPGVDVHATAALCLFESAGFRGVGAEINMSYPSRFRTPPIADIEVRRVLEPDDVRHALAFVSRHFPDWVPETQRAIDHGSCHVAIGDEEIRGFVCHSVNRLGWLGPMGTDPTRRGRGRGTRPARRRGHGSDGRWPRPGRGVVGRPDPVLRQGRRGHGLSVFSEPRTPPARRSLTPRRFPARSVGRTTVGAGKRRWGPGIRPAARRRPALGRA